jgi:hypothetical protein
MTVPSPRPALQALLAGSLVSAALASLVWTLTPVQLHAVITVVREGSCTGNDCTITLPGTPASGNAVLVGSFATDPDTVALASLSVTPVTLAGPLDHSTTSLRGSLFCFLADGTADNATIQTVTSATAVAGSWAIEIAGGSCTEDAAGENTNETTGGVFPDCSYTTNTDGEILFGGLISNSGANWTGGGGTTIVPSSGVEFGAGLGAMGGYRITTTTGAYQLAWDPNGASETSLVICTAVREFIPSTLPAGSLSLLGVGR